MILLPVLTGFLVIQFRQNLKTYLSIYYSVALCSRQNINLLTKRDEYTGQQFVLYNSITAKHASYKYLFTGVFKVFREYNGIAK